MPTARKLPSGSWRCKVFSHYEEVDGKKKRIYRSFTSNDTTKAGKIEAESAALEFKRSRKTPEDKKLRFEDAADQYISGIEPVSSVRTVQSYKTIKRLYLSDLADIDVGSITQDDIQAVINKWSVTLSPKSVRNIHGFISAVLRKYRPDFALRTVLPKKVRPELYVPSDDDIKRLMAFCEGSEMELPILLAAFGPMRRGEICALDAKHIRGNTVHVCKNMVKGDDGWIVKQPKSFAGDRYIDYPDFVAEKWKGLTGRITDLNPDDITHRFFHILEQAGLPHFRFHDLRHYSASIQHALGIPDSYIMQRGGWSTDVTLKSVYRHTMEDREKQMNDLANKHFSKLMHHEMHHENS